MKTGWLAAAGLFLVMFAATVFLSLKLPLLDALGPGPGFFPLILAMLGAALAVALMVQLVRAPAGPEQGAPDEGDDELMPDRAAVFRLLGIVGLLAAAFTALDPVGYRLTALVFVVLLLLVLGIRNIPAIMAVALLFSFGVFHSFYYWLKVPLPVGVLGW